MILDSATLLAMAGQAKDRLILHARTNTTGRVDQQRWFEIVVTLSDGVLLFIGTVPVRRVVGAMDPSIENMHLENLDVDRSQPHT